MGWFKNLLGGNKTAVEMFEETNTDFSPGDDITIEVTLDDVMSSDKTLGVFREKLAKRAGCNIAEMRHNMFGNFFVVYADNGDELIFDEADGNAHMSDFLNDIQLGRKEITPFSIRLKYVGKNL